MTRGPGLHLSVVWFDEHMLEVRIRVDNGKFAGEVEMYMGLDEPSELADVFEGFPSSSSDTRS